MNLIDIYKGLKHDLQAIEDELYTVLKTEHKELQKASSHLLKAGGKRIRPVFVLLAGQNGQYNLERLKMVAVALELIHMASLVHDDVIDFAELRRGKPTVKAKWDNRIAMYTGDFIFAKALEYLTQIEDPRIHRILSAAIRDMSVGEIEQIKAQYQWDQSIRNYFLRIKRKTALLMAVSCQLGGLACSVTEDESKALYRYGYNVGMAFQITDDILDFTGTEKQLGKPAGSDLLQGNITLPVIASFHDLSIKEQIMAECEQEQPNMPLIIRLIKESGGIQRAKQVALMYLDKARLALQGLKHQQSQDMLLEITRFIEQRNY